MTSGFNHRDEHDKFPKANGVGVTFDGKKLPIISDLFSFSQWVIYCTYDLPLPSNYEGKYSAYAGGQGHEFWTE